MSQPPFDALLCDLGNVIAFFDHRITAQGLARITGLDSEEVYRRVFTSKYNDAFVLGHIDENEFYSRMRTLFNDVPFPDYDEFVNLWVMIFRPNHRMVEALDDLRGRAELVMVSNTNSLHFEWIRGKFPQIVSPFGDKLVLSHEVHLKKPQPEMFEKAVELAGVPASRCLFVDDIEQYIDAAEEVGIPGLHYTDHKKFLHAAFPGEYLP